MAEDGESLTVRRATASDTADLALLATLDGSFAPAGDVLVAGSTARSGRQSLSQRDG